MAELIIEPIITKLIETGFEFLKAQPSMKDHLERLRVNYTKIKAVVSYANRAQTEDQALNEWIWQLRDAIDEADDLLDDFEYNNLKNKNSWQTLIKDGKRALKIDPNLKRLVKVVKKLDQVSTGVGDFLHLLKDSKQEQWEQEVELRVNRESGSSPDNDLVGRGKDMESVLQWLKNPSDETTTGLYRNISLLSIVGHGGMGKTTLLQHVYNNEMANEFNLKMWVCVSDNFDVNKVISDMLESLQKKRPSLETLDALQRSLESEVMSKKFLLVLDDLWDKEEEDVLLRKWGKVFSPLACGGLGSKILITTRTDDVASMIEKVIRKKIEPLRLEGLEEEECLQLLTTHAFAIRVNPDDHQNLKSIAGELVKKLCGSPLAAKVMGGVLNSSLDEGYWRNVLNNSLGLKGIIPILKLSYIFLPEHLQSCFSFCSIFEQDHLFDKDDLVQMWIAAGFIQSSYIQGETPTLEDIGESYLDVLIKKSFFDEVSTERYKMHDLLHELAQFVSTQKCFRFAGDEKSQFLQIPKTIRHLSFETDNPELLKEMERFKNLRTLLIKCDNQSFVDAFDKMLKVTRSVRLLHINDDIKLEVIPENIVYLHHLRFLSFRVSDVKRLPRSLSSLYHLQFLIIKGYSHNCSNDYFPRDMNNLSNLRYLKCQQLNFPEIRKLKFLQRLDEFCIENKNGYRIDELGHMNDLRYLDVNNLQYVRDAREACSAKLCDKRKLTSLYLNWVKPINGQVEDRDIADPNLDEKVLNNLEPHNCLKTLSIMHYNGARSAKWMNGAHLIHNLQIISLWSCFQWEILPPFGQLPFLKTLWLENMPKVKRLENKFHGNEMCCCVFPSLETLYFLHMEALVHWFDASVDDGLFPCLTGLYLYDCPNLQELPYLPPKLKSLELYNIGWKTLNCCSISKSISLKRLIVRNCENITSISMARGINTLSTLEIIGCPNLIPFGEEHQEIYATENCQLILDDLIISHPSVLQIEPLRSCTSIRSLEIEGNDNLVSFPFEVEEWFRQISSSLRVLTFRDLSFVQSLPCSLINIASLEILEVCRLAQLREIPNLPPSLKKLTFIDLPSVQSLPCSLTNIASLEILDVCRLAQLREIPNLPPSLKNLIFIDLPLVQSLPSSLTSITSLENLYLNSLPQLLELQDLPCSLKELTFIDLPLVQSLPSSLTSITSLEILDLNELPQLLELPDLPCSLKELIFRDLPSVQSLPSSLTNISSLEILKVELLCNLRELPDLPSSLKKLTLKNHQSLQSLPCSLANIASLEFLELNKLPRLRKLPDLPRSLKKSIITNCNRKLMKRNK